MRIPHEGDPEQVGEKRWKEETTQLSLALTVLFADIIFTAARSPVPTLGQQISTHTSPHSRLIN